MLFINQQIDSEVLNFYGWWQSSVCFFAFMALMAIWWHIGKKQKDFGQVWLALSVLCWCFSGMFEIYFSKSSPLNLYYQGWLSIFSLFNSLFILLALPWFRYLPSPLKHLIKSNTWKYIVGIPFIFSLGPTINLMVSGKSYGIINQLDVYYAFFTLIFLGYVLWESFEKRRLKLLSWLTVLCTIIILAAQLYKLLNTSINLLLFSAIFKTCLIMLFFALAMSWVKELAENVIPKSENLSLIFSKTLNKTGKLEQYIHLNGFPGSKERKVSLSGAHYNLLLKFAQHKKSEAFDDWLEIKPKNYEHNKEFEINDHNQIKRLLSAILDNLFGKENWSKDHHYIPLKNTLFQMSEHKARKIRLALPKENIFL